MYTWLHLSDGNGRMGRLWQTLILSRWNRVFTWVPVESLVHAHQADYYAALAESTRCGDSGVFIGFMLTRLSEALDVAELGTPPVTPLVTPPVGAIIRLLGASGELGNAEIREHLGLRDRTHLRERYLAPCLDGGLIEMTRPDTPRSRLQRYRLTAKGVAMLEALGS